MQATRISIRGLRTAWNEAAFKLEILIAAVLLPGSLWLGRTWAESAVLSALVVAVLVVELLNTAVETVVDRVGLEWHELSGRAKDLGSAAVLICVTFTTIVWICAIAVKLAGL